MENRIAVTGANGQLGKAVVAHLMSSMPASRIIACVRDPAKATALAARGITIRQADFGDAQHLPDAFAGAAQVLVISVDKLGEAALQLHRDAIAAAATAGAQRILYTSHMAAHPASLFAPAVDHAATEQALSQSGVAFTSLRHGFYAESALHMIGHGLKAGEIRVPEDGPVSWTARADLAEADAMLLAQEGRLTGITPPLTASEAVTMADIAAIASEVAGREIRHVTVSDKEWLDGTIARGVPEAMAAMLLGTYKAARRGEFAATDPALETLLGRRPQSMRDVLAHIMKPAADGHGQP